MLIVENILSHLRSAACYHGWALFCHGRMSFGLLTAMPAFATIIICYGFMLHHSTPPVTCPPQVTISGVLLISFLLFPFLAEHRCFLGEPH